MCWSQGRNSRGAKAKRAIVFDKGLNTKFRASARGLPELLEAS